jgi:hypothetical protein
VITGDEVMRLLSDASPSWSALHPGEVSASAEDDLAEYEPVAEFAHHLVDLAARGDASELPAVAEVVEAVLVDGDAMAVSLIRTGLIEDLQNITSHRDVPVRPDAFRAVLGPRAVEVWDELDEAWAAATPTGHGEGRGGRSPATAYLDLAPTDRRRVQSMTRELPDGTLASPSDVLRYEAEQYDAELGRWLRFARAGPVVYIVAILVIVLAVYVFVRG